MAVCQKNKVNSQCMGLEGGRLKDDLTYSRFFNRPRGFLACVLLHQGDCEFLLGVFM